MSAGNAYKGRVYGRRQAFREESKSDAEGDERRVLLRCGSHARKNMCCRTSRCWKCKGNESRKTLLLRLGSGRDRGGLMMYSAARVRNLRIGRRVIRAAGMARRTYTMHVNLVPMLGHGRRSSADC